MKAVIPAAGKGTRMNSITGGTPKELLLVAGRPLIEYALNDIYNCGIKEVCLITRKDKYGLEEIARQVASRMDGDIIVQYQQKPCGIADAVSKAKDFVGNSWFSIIVPDLLFIGENSALSQILKHFEEKPRHMSGLYKLSAEEIHTFDVFGMNDSFAIDKGKFQITNLHEKGIIAYEKFEPGTKIMTPPYIVSPLYLELINIKEKDFLGEIDDGPILRSIMKRSDFIGIPLVGKLFDVGNPRGYLSALNYHLG